MTIVHVVIGGEVAGGQLVALLLARASRERGDEVRFVSPSAGAFVDLARAEGYEVRVVPLGGAFDLRGLVRLRGALRGADVVHGHGQFSLNTLTRVAARLARARVVSHLHIENVFRSGRGRRAQIALDNLTARLCARIVAVSRSTQDALVAQGYPPGRIVTIPNGIDLERVQPLRPGGVPEGVPLVGEVARLCDVKGQSELLHALDGLDGVHCVLVGVDLEQGGAFRAGLEREAEELGLAERVVFTGYRSDARSLIAGLDVFVLPSWTEGLPLTVLEAMAQARPVVATAVGGTGEAVLHGETGLLVAPRDVEALRAAIAELVADPERARALGEAGRRRVEAHFSVAGMTDAVLALYEEIA